MTGTIPRMRFTEVDEFLGEREELARRASKVLGYNKLAQALVVPDALLYTLRRLGIEPLVKSGVETYKHRKSRPGMWSSTKSSLKCLTVSAILATTVCLGFNRVSWEHPSAINIGFIAMGLASLVTAVLGLVTIGDRHGTRVTRKWERIRLNLFAGNVPEFALERALQINDALPSVKFYVEQLIEEQEELTRPSKDPFLIAQLNDETYYIDVWDEKEYEAKI